MSCYELVTWQGTVVQTDDTTGLIHSAAAEIPGSTPIVVWVPASHHNVCFLAAAESVRNVIRPALDGDEHVPGAISLRLLLGEDGHVSLVHPLSGRVVCAEPAGEDGRGRVSATRAMAGPWEGFTLRALPGVSVAPPTDLAQIEGTMAAIGTAHDARSFLMSQPIDDLRKVLWLQAIMRLLKSDEVEWLGRVLGKDTELCRRFAVAFEADIWAEYALPGLVAIAARPGKTFQRDVPPAYDGLAVAGLNGRYETTPQMCNAFARRDRAPTKPLCIVATARNEGLYLLEWIAYHRAMGVEAFFIYTNDNDDHSDALYSALVENGVINWFTNRPRQGVSVQHNAYGHAFQMLPEILDYRWVAVIDLDEFIVVDKAQFSSIPEFIAAREVQRTDAIALNWLMFGSNGHVELTNDSVLQRFPKRDPEVNAHVKTLCRPQMFIHSHCHNPVWDDFSAWTFHNSVGGAHPKVRDGVESAFSPQPTDRFAWINHYHTKSAEEFILRRAMSRADMAVSSLPSGDFFGHANARYFIEQHDSDAMVTDTRASECVPGLLDEIARLRALPGVDAAMHLVERSFRDRLEVLATVVKEDGRFAVPDSPEKWFRDVLDGALSRSVQV